MIIYEHFRKEEHPFIERAVDWLEQVENYHDDRLTDFLDPRQVYILQTLKAKYANIALHTSGGYPGAERCRVMICQDYAVNDALDYRLTAFQITGAASAFEKLEHKDFLGALLNCGLKRDKFGDILRTDGCVQLIVAQEIAGYVQLQLKQVHRVTVSLEEIPLESIISGTTSWKQSAITIPSTRADVVVGEVFHLSRSKVLTPIRAGHLKVNWMVVDSPSFELKVGDIISLRGYGRFKVMEEEGQTRKGNIRIQIGLLR
ncbi:MAG TPA: YlmH/Sll1252 family protein [Bacillota bacterium]|nr:YlmH/Sll1252 family protein [Bacillota bacterium]